MPLALSLPTSETDSQWIILAVGVFATVFLLYRGRMKLKKRDPFDPPSVLSPAQQRAIERDLTRLITEITDMARQVTAQIDNRVTKLELLLEEADRKITQLQAGQTQTSQAHTAPPSGTDVDEHPHFAPPPEHPPDPRHADVYALADEGRNAFEISQTLDRPRGEIELILALRSAK